MPANQNINFYYYLACPPCRSVLLLSKALGIQMNKKVVNIMNGDQLKPEYLRLNPQHTVPTLIDNDLILTESRAILQYLSDNYGINNSLSPKEPKQAAIVNQKLFFDACTLNPRLIQYMAPVIKGGEAPDMENLKKLEEGFEFMDDLMENKIWGSNKQLTIADIALITTISTAEAINVEISKFPNVYLWYQRTKNVMAQFGYEEINQTGCDMIGEAFNNSLRNNN